MKLRYLVLTITTLIVLLSGCRKDTFLTELDTTPATPQNLYETTISGFVMDGSNDPIADASVSLMNSTVLTNQFGYFEITGLVNKQLALLTVSKSGYFNQFKTLSPSASNSATNRIRIQLINRLITGAFESSTGGSISVGESSKVIFQENSVTDSEGNSFSGPVVVYAHYLDPTDINIDLYMPGNLMAINTQNEMNILQSFGMINVELESTSGEALNISKPATIEVEVPSALLGNAPATIPLWYIDESDGLWKEEGSASLQGDVYAGEVSHFTTWNCDVPGTFTFIDGQVIDGRGVPFVKIRLTDQASGAAYSAWIDSEGFFSGVVPQDVELLFEILGFCGDEDVLFSSLVGPFAEDQVDLGVFDITNNNSFTFFTGSLVDCDQMPLSSGEVYFNSPNQGITQQTSIDEFGNFFALIPSCDMEEIIVRGLNLSNGLVSDKITVIPDGQPKDLGMIEVCIDVSPLLGSVEMNLYDLGILAEQKTFNNCTVRINPNNSLGQTSYIFTYYELLPPVNDSIVYFWVLDDANNDINNPYWVTSNIFYSPPASAENSIYYRYTPILTSTDPVTIDQIANNTGELMRVTFNNITIGRRINDPDGPNVLTSFAGSNISITAVLE